MGGFCFVFLFCVQNRTFCNLECLHCFCSLSKRILNALKRYYVWPWNALTVMNKIVFTSIKKGIFSLDVNKYLRLQVTLNSRYAKIVIRYSFIIYLLKGRRVTFRVMKLGRYVTVDVFRIARGQTV